MSKTPKFESRLKNFIGQISPKKPAVIVALEEPRPIRIYRIVVNAAEPVARDAWIIIRLLDERISEKTEIGSEKTEIGRHRFEHSSRIPVLVIDHRHRLGKALMPLVIAPNYKLEVAMEVKATEHEDWAFTLYVEARSVE